MQPLSRECLSRAKSMLPHPIGLRSYMSILSHFDPSITSLDPDEPSSGVPIIGFSATFGRHDGLALGAVFDHIVYHHELSDMIRDKWFGFMPPFITKWVCYLTPFIGSAKPALPRCQQT